MLARRDAASWTRAFWNAAVWCKAVRTGSVFIRAAMLSAAMLSVNSVALAADVDDDSIEAVAHDGGYIRAGYHDPQRRPVPVDITVLPVFAKQLERSLANRGVRAALIALNGRPRHTLPAGIRYTHAAFAVYSKVQRADGSRGRGYVIYNLYQDADAPSRSVLKRDLTVDLIAGANVLEVCVAIPKLPLQQRLLRVIQSPNYRALHNPE